VIYLSLGSNLGNREANLERAIEELRAFIGVVLVSSIYKNKAHLLEGSPAEWDIDFFNIMVACRGEISPEKLLKRVKSIEAKMGRNSDAAAWSPRIIDIDIIAIGGLVMESEGLIIPHLLADKRDFVLLPMQEIEPNWVHPKSGKGITEMIGEL